MSHKPIEDVIADRELNNTISLLEKTIPPAVAVERSEDEQAPINKAT